MFDEHVDDELTASDSCKSSEIEKTFTHITGKMNVKKRLDWVLVHLLNNESRAMIQKLIKSGNLRINGETNTSPSTKLQYGQVIELDIPKTKPYSVEPEDLPLDIIYEDADVVVVNKPPNMTVHPANNVRTGTLVNALLYHIKDLSGIGGVARPGIVHRLDHPTSGLVLVAKNDRAHIAISNMFMSRQIEKRYLCVVKGYLSEEEGEVALPIGRHPVRRNLMAVIEGGRPSVTRYNLLHRAMEHSILAVHPLTGRTHQIRVHLSHMKHPIANDKAYGYRLKHIAVEDLKDLLNKHPGICLHAHKLKFIHPVKQNLIELEANLPITLQSVVNCLYGASRYENVLAKEISHDNRKCKTYYG